MTIDYKWGDSPSPREIAEVSRLGELARGISHKPFIFEPKAAKNSQALLLLVVLLGLTFFCYLFVLIEDIQNYRVVSSDQHGCCGFVSESWIQRPVTYAMVDEWLAPVWTVNGDGSELWLTADGLLDGNRKFWRILQRVPVASDQ